MRKSKSKIEKDIARIFEESGIAKAARTKACALELQKAMQMTVDYIANRTDWVSVREQLPDTDENGVCEGLLLRLTEDLYVQGRFVKHSFFNIKEFYSIEDGSVVRPTHWMVIKRP